MATAPSPQARPEAQSPESLHLASLLPLRTGMPELCRLGLSEAWLLKACGHRHWMALAAAFGLERPEFRDGDGARLYPAFTAITIARAALESVGENALVDFAVTLQRTGRTSFRSTIAVTADGRPVAQVTMDSAFIRRMQASAVSSANGTVRRGIVAGPCRLLPPAPGLRKLRAPLFQPVAPLSEMILDPAPHEDFNGVGLLYCASFLAMLDRAEWHWLRHTDPLPATRHRAIRFLGNADLGDRIRATLHRHDKADGGFTLMVTLSRESDGALIAEAVTTRALIPAMDLLQRVA